MLDLGHRNSYPAYKMSTLKITSALLVVCSCGNALVAQESKDVSTITTHLTIRIVEALINQTHIDKPKIDDEFCGRWFDKYIESLDPMHLYFFESDISEFRATSAQLPRIMKEGDPEFCNLVTSRYKRRVETALSHVEQRIDKDFNFSIDEEKPLFYDNWPQSVDDRKERWRMQLKHDLLVEESTGIERTDASAFVKARYASIRDQARKMHPERAIEIFLDSFCLTADPHCHYINPRLHNSFFGSMLERPYSTGLGFKVRKGRAIIQTALPGFQTDQPQPSILGCELLAIRTQAGVIHNVREIDLSAIFKLIGHGLDKDSSITLELYDEVRQRRFSVVRLRKPPP